MKLSSLLTILVSIIAITLYFSHPITTGPELVITQDLFLPLPQNRDMELFLDPGIDFQHDQVIPIRTEENIGAFLLDHGLLRWVAQEDFATVNHHWLTSYSYANPNPTIVSTTSENAIVSNPGWYPFIVPYWVGELQRNGNSIRFGQNSHIPDRMRNWSWASIITGIDGNISYLAVSLADGRIVIFSEHIGEWEPPITLIPEENWFRDGSFSQRIPIHVSFVNNFLVSIYGSQEPRVVIWDARTWTIIEQFMLPDLLSISTIDIQGFKNDLGQVFLDFFDGSNAIQIRFLPLEGMVHQNLSWGRLIGYMKGFNLSLHKNQNLNSNRSMFHFYRANDSGSRVLQTVAFDGTMAVHDRSVLWFGQDVYGQVSLHWSGISQEREEIE